MKKTLALLLAALTVAGSVVTAAPETAAWEETTNYIAMGTNSAEAYSVTKDSYPAVTTGQLLTGTIAQSLTKVEEGHTADLMFDGDKATYFKTSDAGGFAYLILDQAYQLTEIRVAPTTAEGVNLDTHFGLMIQGSNDGENWVTIIQRGRDALDANYRIYTPTIAEEQAYQAAGFGVKSSLDGSIWWRGNPDYAFSIYRVFDATVGEIEFYGNPAEATDASTPEKASALDFASSHYFPGNIHEMPDSPVVTVDGSLTGTIIGAGGAWAGATYERCFNGNSKRSFDPPTEGPQCWVGLKMDQPYALTEIRVLPKRDEHGRNNTLYSQVQGSIDGVNWRTLAVFTEIPSSQVYMSKTITDTNGYTYFRYVNCGTRQSSCADLLLFGAPAAAAEPFTAGPVVATHNYFNGEIEYAEAKNTVVDTEISGTPICGRYYYGWTDRNGGKESGFDGNLETNYGSINGRLGAQQWAGLKADAVTVPTTVMINRGAIDDNYYFQGSVDGVNWVDLAVFVEGVDTADAENWYTKTIEGANGYEYFRLINSNIDNWDTGLSFNEMKIYGTPYEAPETEAPETEAPETEAPETEAPETEAPETEAPVAEIADLVAAGEILTSGGQDVSAAFDGSLTTAAYLGGAGKDHWIAVKLAQPAVLSHAVLATIDTNGDGLTDRCYVSRLTVVEGSNDGETWTELFRFGPDDRYDEFEDFMFAHDNEGQNYWTTYSEATEAYTYFKLWNDDDSDLWGEVQLWGTFVEAPETEAPETEAPETTPVSDEFHFYGELVDTGIKNVIPEGIENGVIGTVMGAGATGEANGYDKAFDGTNGTYWSALENKWSDYMIVLKADAPVAAQKFYVASQDNDGDGVSDRRHCIIGSLIQGSNDGINWETLRKIEAIDYEDYLAEAGVSYWELSSDDTTTEYTYFRYVNNDDGAAAIGEFVVVGPEAPETEAPETAAPGKAEIDLVDATVKNGDTVEVVINIATTVPVNAVALYELTYDAAVLEFVEFTGFGDIVTDSFFGTDVVDNTQKTIMFALENAAELNGLVAGIKFNAIAAGTTEVTLSAIVKHDSKVIETVVDSAIVTVEDFVVGDIDDNNELDIKDVLLLFQHAMMPELYPIEYNGAIDFNADGLLDIKDALRLFQGIMLPDLYPLV